MDSCHARLVGGELRAHQLDCSMESCRAPLPRPCLEHLGWRCGSSSSSSSRTSLWKSTSLKVMATAKNLPGEALNSSQILRTSAAFQTHIFLCSLGSMKLSTPPKMNLKRRSFENVLSWTTPSIWFRKMSSRQTTRSSAPGRAERLLATSRNFMRKASKPNANRSTRRRTNHARRSSLYALDFSLLAVRRCFRRLTKSALSTGGVTFFSTFMALKLCRPGSRSFMRLDTLRQYLYSSDESRRRLKRIMRKSPDTCRR
mmetsp:Transcript_7738/g.20186  ORF Transcript_7738/g.20186 Transcript_7738/m.20186 type:complete len:257 (-) Transcript_7738:481-1251(-)